MLGFARKLVKYILHLSKRMLLKNIFLFFHGAQTTNN
jgi:hypothetical protein